jgi:hypothetical protein
MWRNKRLFPWDVNPPEDDQIAVLQPDIGEFRDPEIEVDRIRRIMPFFNAHINLS